MNNPNFTLFDVTLPVGAIIPFVGNVEKYTKASQNANTVSTKPIECFGWMVCDGSSLNASEYPELYAALGDLYGTPKSNEAVTFNLPDLRNQFLRGIGTSDGAIDNRKKAPGGTTNGVGSTQKDALQTHEHIYVEPTGTPAPGESAEGTATVNKNAQTGIPVSTPNKNPVKVSNYETRPVNTFVNYLIKYTYKLPRFNHTPNFL